MDMSVCLSGPLETSDCLRTPSMTTLTNFMRVVKYKFVLWESFGQVFCEFCGLIWFLGVL
jgi:hypothetical protein